MSWDVILLKTKTNTEEIKDIKDVIPFQRSELLMILSKQYPDINSENPSWLVLDKPNFSIEFNIDEKESIDIITLHIRGKEEPTKVLMYLCQELDCRAIDSSASEFIDFNKETTFNEWKRFRDTVMHQK